jgi:glutathione S-transferase
MHLGVYAHVYPLVVFLMFVFRPLYTMDKHTVNPQLYVDLFSQPSRACVILIKANGLDIDIKHVSIARGDTRRGPLKDLNPLGKASSHTSSKSQICSNDDIPLLLQVPFLFVPSVDLHLPESAAILEYLADRYRVAEHWLPSQELYPSLRATVMSGVHWWHSNIRAGCARLVFHTVIGPRLKKPVNHAIKEEGIEILQQSLDILQTYWLRNGTRNFMCGSEVSIADLLNACELEQVCMLNKEAHGTDLDDQLASRPIVRAWMKRVRESCGNAYDEAHAPLWKSASRPSQSKL